MLGTCLPNENAEGRAGTRAPAGRVAGRRGESLEGRQGVVGQRGRGCLVNPLSRAGALMCKPCTQPMAGALHATSSMDSEQSDQQLIERLRRAAHACEATGEMWGHAWARWLRTLIVL